MISKDTITKLKLKYNINPKILLEDTIGKMNVRFVHNNFNFDSKIKDINFVIGVSGGKDSTVAVALLQHMYGKDRVYGVSMNRSTDSINRDESLLVKKEYFDDEHWFDSPISNDMIPYFMPLNVKDNDVADYNSNDLLSCHGFLRNLFARIRMCKLYTIAQEYVPHGRVINTSNKSESYLGWTTKWGDNVGDYYPLIHLTAHEIVMIGEELGVPDHLLYKQPKDGMTGTSDETSLGVSYEAVDDFILGNESNSNKDLSVGDIARIKELHQNASHKIYTSECLNPKEIKVVY